MSTLTSFLDDFLVNVFHPQLDETLAELSSQTFIEIDSFSEDPHWAKYSKKPIFKVRRYPSNHCPTKSNYSGHCTILHSHFSLLQNA
jgi:hypothetical protein